jgi:hypothetical protein
MGEIDFSTIAFTIPDAPSMNCGTFLSVIIQQKLAF